VSIDHEIQDLEHFGYALREENRLLFEKMMSELDPESLKKASLAKDPFEVIAMGLIFQQQKMIRKLLEQINEQD
jgi:hypothetical protein